MNGDVLHNSTLTVREKAVLLGVSVGTVINKLHGRHLGKNGGLTKFSVEEEHHVEELLLRCAEFGVPLNKHLFLKVLISVGKDKGKKNANILQWMYLEDFSVVRRMGREKTTFQLAFSSRIPEATSKNQCSGNICKQPQEGKAVESDKSKGMGRSVVGAAQGWIFG